MKGEVRRAKWEVNTTAISFVKRESSIVNVTTWRKGKHEVRRAKWEVYTNSHFVRET
jgi:hypothetical protein